MNPVGERPTAVEYLDFGEHQARGSSECFSDWAVSVASDPEVLARLDTLPPAKRQPNLVFAAARWHGVAAPGPYDELRRVLLDDWEAIRATVLARATQTNEVGRCATLLPVLARLPGPLALLEVGASAGLCLCLDLNPLDVGDDDAMRWLETLVWPEHEDRRRRLAAAVDLVRADPPRLVAGDLNDDLPRLAAEAPNEATLVVFHSAVTAYLSHEARERFVTTVRDLPGHWISNEGPRALPEVAETAGAGPPSEEAAFVLGLDGRAVGWAEQHGRALWWLDAG